jgi:hypothetical protein
MKFQNTERCSTTERLKIVSSEIIDMYPKLSSESILKIAGLCDIVSDNVDCDVMFRRYYYMLLVLRDDKYNFDIVYKDMKKYCKDSLNDKLNNYLYNDIEKFCNGKLDSFPMISDYYGN